MESSKEGIDRQTKLMFLESSAVRGGSGWDACEGEAPEKHRIFIPSLQPRSDRPPVILMMDPNWLETEVAKNKVTVLVFFRGLVSLHRIAMISHQLAACNLSPLL